MSSSSGSTCGPHSLISVYELEVGSTTAVDVRDSPAMCTKSLRSASPVSCSTMRVPVSPPASPVATTGTSSRFSARATLMPLPPARVSPPLARCRWPRWKLGTVSVRSRAALSVTVTIIGLRHPTPHVVRGAFEIPLRAPGCSRLVDRAGGDERRARHELAPLVDAHLTELLALADGQVDTHRRHDTFHERTTGDHCAPDRARGDEVELSFAVRGARPRIDAARGHRLHDTEASQPPAHQLHEVIVANFAIRAPEDRGVDGDAWTANGADLGPAGRRRVPGLDADYTRIGAEEVVPGMQTAIALDRRVAHRDDLADDRLLHQQPSQRRHVARAGDMSRSVEAVRADEVRVVQAELLGPAVHQRDEPGLTAAADVIGERPGGVVRALDQRGFHEVAHRDLLACPQADAGLADLRRVRRDRHDIAQS